jgi:sodium/hydrogen antiporter
VIALAVVLIGWALVSARAEAYSVTIPIALMVAGMLVSGGADPVVPVDLTSSAMRHLLEATLALVLFTAAAKISVRALLSARHLPLRLLLIAFPLTVVAGYLAGIVLFPGASGWVIALIASALAATDASLAAALVHHERMPHDLRTAIEVESGFNDGLAAPLVLFFLAAAVATEYDHSAGSVLSDTVRALAVAVAVGGVLGWGCAVLLKRARERGWSADDAERVAYLAIPALAFGVTHAAHGNGLVAAFVAGLAVSAADAHVPHARLTLAEDAATLLSSAVWFVFGSIIQDAFAGGLNWRVLLYAVLSLTLIRVVPVLLSLLGVRQPWREKALLGWLGPCGLPSVIFALIALERLTGESADLVSTLIVTTVLLSVLAHGLTAVPLADRWIGGSPVPGRSNSA